MARQLIASILYSCHQVQAAVSGEWACASSQSATLEFQIDEVSTRYACFVTSFTKPRFFHLRKHDPQNSRVSSPIATSERAGGLAVLHRESHEASPLLHLDFAKFGNRRAFASHSGADAKGSRMKMKRVAVDRYYARTLGGRSAASASQRQACLRCCVRPLFFLLASIALNLR